MSEFWRAAWITKHRPNQAELIWMQLSDHLCFVATSYGYLLWYAHFWTYWILHVVCVWENVWQIESAIDFFTKHEHKFEKIHKFSIEIPGKRNTEPKKMIYTWKKWFMMSSFFIHTLTECSLICCDPKSWLKLELVDYSNIIHMHVLESMQAYAKRKFHSKLALEWYE